MDGVWIPTMKPLPLSKIFGGIAIYRTYGTSDRDAENFLHNINQHLDVISTTNTGQRMLTNLAFGNATSIDGQTVGIFDIATINALNSPFASRPVIKLQWLILPG